MARLRTSRLASLGVLLFACLMAPAFAQERLTRQVNFDIAAQSVEAALIEFSKQADVQVMVGGKLNGQKTEGVKGKLSVKEALSQLLKNTGLEYQTEGNNTVTIRSPAAAKAGAQVTPLVNGMTMARNGAQEEAGGSGKKEEEEPRAPSVETLDEIVVTGSHIRGQQSPVGAQLITLDRAEIDRIGLATVHDVVRTLPQNFGGGPSEDTSNGSEALANTGRATALNLRGLGAGATLVLINGRRLAPSGQEGTFTDVSSIPLTAVERVDVLPDGASALYGSDAIGGVVNVILRRNFTGAETFARAGTVTSGNSEQLQFGQMLGTQWSSGSGTVSYEYSHRDALAMSARSQTRSSDLRAFGGNDFTDSFSNPGTIQIGLNTWAIPAGQDGTSLSSSDLTPATRNPGNRNLGRDYFADQARHSVYARGGQAIGDSVSLFVDGLFTRRDIEANTRPVVSFLRVPASNPFYVNPLGGTGPVTVQYSFEDDFGPKELTTEVETSNTAVGADVELPMSWRLSLLGAYAREKLRQRQESVNSLALNLALADTNPATAFNAFGDGSHTNPSTLSGIRARSGFDSTSELSTFSISAEGPTFDIGSGTTRLFIGAEVRRPKFESETTQTLGVTDPISASYSRTVRAAFAEVAIPLIGTSRSRTGLERLSLSLAARTEDYDDFGSATTPKVGIEWSLSPSVQVKGTWSKSFKAPNVGDLSEAQNSSFLFTVPDADGNFVDVLLWDGKNADLTEERATSRTLGLTFGQGAETGGVVDLTYFDVSFEDRIQGTPFTETWLIDPRFASVVALTPTLEQRQRVCSSGTFFGGADECLTAPIAAIVDLRLQNTAISEISGLDLTARYSHSLSLGDLSAELNASYMLDYSQALTTAEPIADLLNTATNPIDLRLRGSLSFARAGFVGTAFVNYTDNYRDNLSAQPRRISSWTTVDMQFAYDTGEGKGTLDKLNIALSAQNVFDKDPPFFNNPNGVGYDQENADLLGRFVSIQVRKRW